VTATSPALRLPAPAKINLYLHVVGRRADGYHLIDSLVAFAALGDTLAIEPAERLTLAVEGPFAGALAREADNLVLRAARLLAETVGIEPRARIRLVKRLPVASGIGGGSADAAATLAGLVRLWNLDMPHGALTRLGLQLGADVPVCLAGSPVFVSGIGEEIAPAPRLPDCAVVLANPHRPVPTAAVYGTRSGPFQRPAPFAENPVDIAALGRLLLARGNGLATAAAQIEPTIPAVIAALEALEDCILARLCGSGATCYGLFADEQTARKSAQRLARAHPDWWVAAARLLRPGETPDLDQAA
jgi:4-diphosphocytidyl-2-C-methyl-D-erythritol kinase